jgi:hypothetical protein
VWTYRHVQRRRGASAAVDAPAGAVQHAAADVGLRELTLQTVDHLPMSGDGVTRKQTRVPSVNTPVDMATMRAITTATAAGERPSVIVKLQPPCGCMQPARPAMARI